MRDMSIGGDIVYLQYMKIGFVCILYVVLCDDVVAGFLSATDCELIFLKR